MSSSGKTQHFDCCIRRFKSCHPSQKSASIKNACRFYFLPFTFLADVPPLKWRWASLRQAGGIFSKNRFQKESVSLFNPSVIFAIASLVKGGGLPQGKPEGFYRVIWNLNRACVTFNPSVRSWTRVQLLTGESPLCRSATFPHTVGNHPM